MEATRHLGQYSQSYPVMYLLALAALTVFSLGIFRRYRIWRIGTGSPLDRLDHLGKRSLYLIRNLISHRRILENGLPGIAHLILYYGFLVFFLSDPLL